MCMGGTLLGGSNGERSKGTQNLKPYIYIALGVETRQRAHCGAEDYIVAEVGWTTQI